MSRSFPDDAMDLPPSSVTAADGHGSPSLHDEAPAVERVVAPGAEDGCAVYWLDLAGRVTRWAESCAAVFGSRGGSPASFEELFVPEDRRKGIPALILRHARDLGSWDGTGWRVGHGGVRFWAASSVSLVRTPNGLEIGYMIVTRNLEQLRSHEPEPVDDERARLASLGRVASEVSHDVRNILAAIRGFASALEQLEPANASSGAVRAELLKACDRGTLLTQRLLGVGTTERAGPEPTDLGRLVREAEPLLRQVVPARIQLRVRVDSDVPTVLARSSDVELALLNLVLNARDAIPSTGIIEVAVTATARDAARLTVRDTGTGMSREVLARCRERAFTTKGHRDGSGLGLAIVQEAARDFGAAFEIDSEVGHGTTAAMIFPASGSVEGEAPRDSVARRSDPRSTPVVLWSSSPLSADLLGGVLRRGGWHVSAVSSPPAGAEALERLRRRSPIVVLDGAEAARSLALLLRHGGPSCRTILLAESPVEDDLARLFDQQLIGPIDPDVLVACVAGLSGARPEDRMLGSVH